MGVRYLRVSVELLLELFRDGHEIHVQCEGGLPDDARLVLVRPDDDIPGVCIFMFEAESWPVSDSERYLNTTFRQLNQKPGA